MSTSTKELDDVLYKLLPGCYRGAWACDQIPAPPSNCHACFIVNTDNSEQDGSHWLGIYIPPRAHHSIFIDPQNLPHHTLNRSLRNYFSMYELEPIKTMPFAIQGPRSLLCGPYCAFTLYNLSHYRYDICRLTEQEFSEFDFQQNDFKVRRWWRGIKARLNS